MASNNLTLDIDIERTTTRWRRKTKDLTLEISEDLIREWFRCVGAEIVVRCEDCKWYDKHDKRCKVWNHGVLSIGYCYRGEEREDETAD